jgi:hypothetical protein
VKHRDVDDSTGIAALMKLVHDEAEAAHAVLEPDPPDKSNYYVQFALGHDGRLYCETASNV